MPASNCQHQRMRVGLRRRLFCLTTIGLVVCSCSQNQTVPPMPPPPELRIPAVPPPTVVTPPPSSVTPVSGVVDKWAPQASPRDWKFIVIHHTATETGSTQSIHRTHLTRKDANGNPWRGIGYHFVIGNGKGMDDGAVDPTFRWRDQIDGAHAGDAVFNRRGIGICLIGNFEKAPPTDAQLTALKSLTQSLSNTYNIPKENVMRHGDVKATACPGKLFPMQEVRQMLDDGK